MKMTSTKIKQITKKIYKVLGFIALLIGIIAGFIAIITHFSTNSKSQILKQNSIIDFSSGIVYSYSSNYASSFFQYGKDAMESKITISNRNDISVNNIVIKLFLYKYISEPIKGIQPFQYTYLIRSRDYLKPKVYKYAYLSSGDSIVIDIDKFFHRNMKDLNIPKDIFNPNFQENQYIKNRIYRLNEKLKKEDFWLRIPENLYSRRDITELAITPCDYTNGMRLKISIEYEYKKFSITEILSGGTYYYCKSKDNKLCSYPFLVDGFQIGSQILYKELGIRKLYTIRNYKSVTNLLPSHNELLFQSNTGIRKNGEEIVSITVIMKPN